MASIITVLAPMILVAFTLQGCLFSNLQPAAKVAIGHQCHDKVTKISDAAGLKDVHAAQACTEMDADELSKFKVTNCKQVVHDMLHFALGAMCEYDVTEKAADSCKPPLKAGCKTAVDAAVLKFPSGDDSQSNLPAEPQAEKDGGEILVGLVKHCSAAVNTAIASDSAQKFVSDLCGDMDKDSASIMGVDADHCKEYLEQQLTEIGTIACVSAAMTHDDAPTSPDTVTVEWMEKAAKEFGDAFASNPEGTTEKGLGSDDARLRLFQAMREMRWPGKLRRWSPASVMAAWAASGLALVALLGLAWRRLSTRQPAPHDKPILDDELQLAE